MTADLPKNDVKDSLKEKFQNHPSTFNEDFYLQNLHLILEDESLQNQQETVRLLDQEKHGHYTNLDSRKYEDDLFFI